MFDTLMQPSMGILTLPCPRKSPLCVPFVDEIPRSKIHPPFTFIDRKLGQDYTPSV